jgi:hypothetical protein
MRQCVPLFHCGVERKPNGAELSPAARPLLLCPAGPHLGRAISGTAGPAADARRALANGPILTGLFSRSWENDAR